MANRSNPVGEAEAKEMVQLYNEGTSAKDIANAYKRTPSVVYYWLAKHGVAMKNPKPGAANPIVILAPMQTLEDQIAELKQKLAIAEAKKAELAIRFEWVDETTIMVHGVTEFFIFKEGIAKLKYEIEHHTPQRRIDTKVAS